MMINVGTVETKPLNQVATWLGVFRRCLLNLADLGAFKGRSINTKGDVANERGAICVAMRSILINQRGGSFVENKIPWLVLERAKLELEAAAHVFVTQSIR
jgi:hypothetical protein